MPLGISSDLVPNGGSSSPKAIVSEIAPHNFRMLCSRYDCVGPLVNQVSSAMQLVSGWVCVYFFVPLSLRVRVCAGIRTCLDLK